MDLFDRGKQEELKQIKGGGELESNVGEGLWWRKIEEPTLEGKTNRKRRMTIRQGHHLYMLMILTSMSHSECNLQQKQLIV